MYVQITNDQKEQALKVSILSFVSEQLRPVSPNQLAGPCPFCGGNDRFNILTDVNKWFCRKNVCGGSPSHKPGSVIDFVSKMYGLGFADAVLYLAGEARGSKAVEFPVFTRKFVSSSKKPPVTNKAQWQATAKRLLVRANEVIDKYIYPVDYLQGRGVNLEVAMRFKVGYCPQKFTMPCQAWGIEPTNDIDTMTFSQGLLIPTTTNGIITHLNIRSSSERAYYKYKAVKGSSKAIPFNFDELSKSRVPVLLLESEIDGMIIKSIPDLDGVIVPISTLSITGCRNKQVIEAINRHSLLLNAYDNEDNTDVESACNYWKGNTTTNYYRLQPLKKDIGEMHKHGDDIVRWIRNGIEKANPSAVQLAMRL